MNRAEATEELHGRASEVLRALHTVLSAQPRPEHKQLEVLERALATWQRRTGTPLRLQLVAGGFFASGRLIRLDAWTFDRALDLSRILSRRGIGTIHFPADCRAHQLSEWVEALATTRASLRVAQDLGGIGITPAGADAPGGGTLGLAGLVDILTEDLASTTDGEPIDLLPVKHLLALLDRQLDIEPAPPLDAVGERSHDIVDALIFARYLGLGRRERTVLPLAAALVRLSGTDQPEETLAFALRCEGTGELTEDLLAATHDAAYAREGGVPESAAGALVALLLDYRDRLEGRSPAEALFALEGRWGVDTPLLRLLAAWKLARSGTDEGPEVQIIDDDPSSFVEGNFAEEEDPTDMFTEDTVRRWRGDADGEGLPDPDRWVPKRFRKRG